MNPRDIAVKRKKKKKKRKKKVAAVLSWLLNVPATCSEYLRDVSIWQLCALPYRSCRSNFEMPDMTKSGGCPQEALGTGWDTAADCRLRLTHWTEDLAWSGTQKKKKKLAILPHHSIPTQGFPSLALTLCSQVPVRADTGVIIIIIMIKLKGTIRDFLQSPHCAANGLQPGVALTFEKLRIANAQHGKNCVSSPAAKTTINTVLPKREHKRLTNFVQFHFNLRHAWRVCVISVYGCHEHRNVDTSIPSPGWDGEGRGKGAGEI